MLLPNVDWSRVIVIPGDMKLVNFGLKDTEFLALGASIDLIIHCAAAVNHILPYSYHKPTNVDGTTHVRFVISWLST
jgi:thioester reductase-like protein